MDINEVKKQIKDNIKWDSKRPPMIGGQSCGMPTYPVILKSDELDLEITIGFHRSQLKNKELAFTLFELVVDELIK
jgi:hypothetical protein